MTTATRTKPTTETLTRRTSTGLVFALSSDGVTEYRISLDAATCTCTGYAYRGTCRHLVAAQQRYAETGCAACSASPLGVCWEHAPRPTETRLAAIVRRDADDVSDLY